MERNDVIVAGIIFFAGIVIYSAINGLVVIGMGAMVILFFLLLGYR